ncbi:MAG: DUF4249 domain-containing protein [Tannerellaceae bacterium]|jgi:hypothetical protein|nr:DUF4249 domain-containing protein [Tannerellaceae bacterium]
MKHLIFLPVLLLTSCYSDIDMKNYQGEPKLVLNSAISPDTIVMASVSRTLFFTDTVDYEKIANAKVELYVNGVFMEQLQWDAHSGLYISTYTPRSEDLIKLVVITAYGTVWAEDVVPLKVKIEQIEISYRELFDQTAWRVDGNGNMMEIGKTEFKYQITFQDDITRTNYYLICIENADFSDIIGNLDYSLDPVFLEQESLVNSIFAGKTINGQGGRAFSDKMINGLHTSVITETEVGTRSDMPSALLRIVSLYSLSESYYHYLLSLQRASDANEMISLSGYGLAEPIRIYSNVNGGTGIMAASQRFVMNINLDSMLYDDSK